MIIYLMTYLYITLYGCRQKLVEQTETKISKMREDFVNTKEILNKAMLSKEVLEQQKQEICTSATSGSLFSSL